MNTRLVRPANLTALILACAAWTSAASGQARIYTYSTTIGATSLSHQYALLNGDLLSLYINDRGDLGAPYQIAGPDLSSLDFSKPSGVGPIPQVDTSSNPAVNGSVLPGNTYGALFSPDPTAGLVANNGTPNALPGLSVQAKRDYFAIGGKQGAVEGFAVTLDGGTTWNPSGFVGPSSLNTAHTIFANTGFSVSPVNDVNATQSATSNLVLHPAFSSSTQNILDITQNVEIQGAGEGMNRAKFTITLTNAGNNALNGVRYARTIDPNQGFVGGSTATTQTFGTPVDPNAFAINSTDSPGSSNPHHLAIGVLPGDPGTNGTTIYSTPLDAENLLLSNLGTAPIANHITLNGTTAQAFIDSNPNPAKSSSGSFVGNTDFANFVNNPNNLFFDQNPPTNDAALVLLSPTYDIGAGNSQEFVFYYFFDAVPTGGPPAVPEPGSLALLACGACSGLLWRRKKSA